MSEGAAPHAVLYDSALEDMTRGLFSWNEDPVRAILVGEGYEPSRSAHSRLSHLKGAEIRPSGTYRSGGATLGGRNVTRGSDAHLVKLTAGRVMWENVTAEWRYVVLYQPTADGEGRLIGYSDVGRQQATNAKVGVEYRDGVVEFEAVTGG